MKLFEKNELRLLWPFYLEKLISHILYFAPAFWILQFQQYFSLFQIGILFGILSISSFVFEIPTGAFADVYGRKASVLLGYILITISIVFLSFVHSFNVLIFVFLLWGLAGTFTSGAKESWIVDNLNYQKQKKLVKEFFVKEQSIIFTSLFLSGLLGAYLVSRQGLDIIWIFAAGSYVLSFAMLFFVKEHKLTKEKKISFGDLFKQSKISIKYAWKHHVLFFMIFATFFIMFRDSFGGDLVWQPFLRSLGLPVFVFGFIFSASTLLGAIAPFLAKRVLKMFNGERNYLAFLLIITIVLDFSVIFVNNYFAGIAVLLLMFLSIYMFMPISQAFFHHHVPGKLRATVTSINGMIIALAYALSYPLSGYLADIITPKYTIALGSIILIPALILYLKIKDKTTKNL